MQDVPKAVWTMFSFLLQTIYELASCVRIPRTIRAFYHVWKWHNGQRTRSDMRRSTTHALYRFKLWQQDHCQHTQNEIRTIQRAQGDENKVSGYSYGLWCGFKWGPHHATSHLRSRLESQHQSVPGSAEECGDSFGQSGSRWQTLGVATGLGASPQVQRNPNLASEGVLRLCTLLSLVPSSPDLNTLDYFVLSYVENITNMTWSPPSADYSPGSSQRLWKRHAPSSGSVSRRWLRLKAATLNRCQLYYIIKLAELIFSMKVLK